MKHSVDEYKPFPVDLSEVVLPEEIALLMESVAKNVHEVWAQARMEEGWTYGKQLDEPTKKHPCLVAYEELPESEKEYDRNTALNSIKLLIKLGYKIEKQNDHEHPLV